MLVMEFMAHGSLYDVVHNESIVLEGDFLLPIFRDIAQGVRFLHSANPEIIHGDLKAHNILIDSNLRAKVADFGLSQKKKDLGTTGTPFWMAPELLRGEVTNNPSTDVYSFGMILFEVYSQSDPYEGEDPFEVLRLVADPNVNKRPEMPGCCPEFAATLIEECLSSEPRTRPTFEEVDSRLKTVSSTALQPIEAEQLRPPTRPQLTENALEKLKDGDRSEELLGDLFPSHVAKALSENRTVGLEESSCATVICAHISDVGGLIGRTSTPEVVKIMDLVHQRLSDLCRKYQIQKIDTNDGAFLAVVNLFDEHPDYHAEVAAQFSFDALRTATDASHDVEQPCMKGDDEQNGSEAITLCIGIHSGPVTANVVGSRCPRYCLFGDTVKIASKMARTCFSNQIQCSVLSANLMRDQGTMFELKQRGSIPLSGGAVMSYWVDKPL